MPEKQVFYPAVRPFIEFLEKVLVAPLEKTCPPPVEPEHDIAEEAEERHQGYHENPGNLASGVLPVRKYDEYCAENHQHIQDREEIGENLQHLKDTIINTVIHDSGK